MKNATRKLLRDYAGAVIAAVLVAFAIRAFLIEAYRIPNTAMSPTLAPGEVIFVGKWKFMREAALPKRGQVVVFSYPSDPGRDYIKRVIGLPGDEIRIREGKLFLNGRALSGAEQSTRCGEETLPEDKTFQACSEPPAMEDYGPETVPNDAVFLISDRRSREQDGRKMKSWGIVPLASLKGVALWTWLSIEPTGLDNETRWFPKLRFDRMFRRID